MSMYLLPIHVPIYVDGARDLVTSEWWRALELLRNSLAGRLGEIVVAAPTLPADQVAADQTLVPPAIDCGIQFVRGFDLRCRARDYWLRVRSSWRRTVLELARDADVVHAGLDDVYRPIAFEGFRAGVQLNRVTLFVQDTDIVIQQRELAASAGTAVRVRAWTYGSIFEQMCRWSVARADLSLLKGLALMSRYGRYARNAKGFQDTSFLSSDILDADRLERRLSTLREHRPLHLVYCGRLAQRKGLSISLELIARAKALGAQLQLDIMGSGPERAALERLAASLEIADRVSFLGALPYDEALLERLGSYDAMLFTPTAEDTPRMIFDGYAAGLPILGFDIGYVQERARQDSAAELLPRGSVAASAAVLNQLYREPERLIELSRNARAAATYHCADNWYARRAEWTFEAIARRKAVGTIQAAA
jgi:glycosyltransferase involved in cell wall biosynthesis